MMDEETIMKVCMLSDIRLSVMGQLIGSMIAMEVVKYTGKF
jgi:hypothetical protein